MRIQQRSISRESIISAVDSYEIIEEYPDDREFPSYLVYGETQEAALHILFAVDRVEENVRVVTSYRPDPDRWDDELKERRE